MDEEKKAQVNQTAKDHLLAYINQSTPYFDEFFTMQKERAGEISLVAQDMVQRYADFIGGKRLRGALTKLGYDIFGGTLAEDIIKVSTIIEFIHGFALMHDDVYDQDEIRRKKPSMHKQYEQLFAEKFAHSKRKKELYGISMATNLGDIGSYYSNLILINTGFSADKKLSFLKRLSEIVIQTVYGQAMDITYELDNIPDEKKVMQIHKFKTAYYTISGPLQYGALLAGMEEGNSRYEALEKYGVPVGIAFQLRDDELGMFSNPEKFGKPIFSDLRQGKNTVLFSYAFEHATKEQYDFLYSVHGNQGVNESDLKRVNELLIETGALDYSHKLCQELISEGKKYIKDITDNQQHQNILDVIADYVVTRES